MKGKGSRLRKSNTFNVMEGRKRLATVKSKAEFDRLLERIGDRTKHRIKLKAE